MRCDMLHATIQQAMEGVPILTVTAVRKQRRRYLQADQGRQVRIGSVFQQDDRLWCVEEFGSPPNATGTGIYASDVERWVNTTIDKHEQCVWFGPGTLRQLETEARKRGRDMDNAAAATSFMARIGPATEEELRPASSSSREAGEEGIFTPQAPTEEVGLHYGASEEAQTASQPFGSGTPDEPQDDDSMGAGGVSGSSQGAGTSSCEPTSPASIPGSPTAGTSSGLRSHQTTPEYRDARERRAGCQRGESEEPRPRPQEDEPMAGASQRDGIPRTNKQRKSLLRRQENREQLAAQTREQPTRPLAADSRGGTAPNQRKRSLEEALR